MSEVREITQDEIELVLARIRAIPDNAVISIGQSGILSKEDLINEVKELTPLGREVIEMQMNYLRSFKKG